MKYIPIIKRAFRYIFKGIPVQPINATVVTLPCSELLKDSVALITGGTSGIGYSIAKAFLNAGADCIITSRNESRVIEACDSLNNNSTQGGRAYGMVWDNTCVEAISKNLTDAIALVKGNNINILVNNAGLVGGEIRDCTEEKYDAIFDTNLKGTFFLSQYFSRYMKENNIKGHILNIGSSSSLRPATSAYTVSKWGIYGLTKGLAKIMAPYGITVNGIAPGPTATPMLMPEGIREDLSFPGNPLGRYILPEEIANMAVFLVSEMGRSVIGDMVFMTGGSGVVTYDDVKYYF